MIREKQKLSGAWSFSTINDQREKSVFIFERSELRQRVKQNPKENVYLTCSLQSFNIGTFNIIDVALLLETAVLDILTVHFHWKYLFSGNKKICANTDQIAAPREQRTARYSPR